MHPFTMTMAARAIDVTLQQSHWISEGIAGGDLVRIGGVVRRAAGSPGAGQIVAHLQEIGAGPRMLGSLVTNISPVAPLNAAVGIANAGTNVATYRRVGQVQRTVEQVQQAVEKGLRLSQIAAGASILNLGVSAAGFAYTAHRLNALQRSIEGMHAELGGRLDAVSLQVQASNEQLWYLRVLGEHDSRVLHTVLRNTEFVKGSQISGGLAEVQSIANQVRRAGGAAVDAATVQRLEAAVTHLGRMAQALDPGVEPDTLLHLDLALQGWLGGTALLAALLDQLGAPQESVHLLAGAEHSADALTRRWASALLADPAPALANPYRFAGDPFQCAILEERVARISRYAAPVADPEWATIEANAELGMSNRPVTGQWIGRQVIVAGVLDQLAESSDRVASYRSLAQDCLDRGTCSTELAREVRRFAIENAGTVDSEPTGLVIIEAANA